MSSKQVLMWAQTVQKAVLDNIRDAKEFNSRETGKNQVRIGSDNANEKKVVENCKYCSTGHLQTWCPMYGKK